MRYQLLGPTGLHASDLARHTDLRFRLGLSTPREDNGIAANQSASGIYREKGDVFARTSSRQAD